MSFAVMFRSRVLKMALLASWAICPVVATGEEALPGEEPVASDSVSEEISANPTTDLEGLAAETLSLMQQAENDFAATRFSDAGAARQSEIVQKLRQLAELANQQAASVSLGRNQSQGGWASPGSNSGDGAAATSNALDAAQSSESATGEAPGVGEVRLTARDLATSVWGHLPARERDRMQTRFSERFLPQYDQLVRDYYKALATDALSQE